MKKLGIFMMVCVLVVWGVAGLALASTINFSEVPLGTENPLIYDVQFYAGDSGTFDSTFTADSQPPGNPYLSNGNMPGPTGIVPFIGGSDTKAGYLFSSVSFDLVAEASSQSGSTFYYVALKNGLQVDSGSVSIYYDATSYALSLSFAGGFDRFVLYAQAYDFFSIDNVDYRQQAVPLPGTLVLLASGLAGLGVLRRRGNK